MFAPLVLAALLTQTTPAPSPSAASTATPAGSPTPAPDPAVLARAKSFFHMLQTGKVDRSQMTADWDKYTDEQFAKVAAQIGPLGEPVTFEQERVAVQNGSTAYVYLLAFGNSTKLEYLFAVDNTSGKVSGLWVRAAQP